MWVNQTTTFRKVESKRTVKLPCSKCGKKRQRVLSTYQTISPFNRDEHEGIKDASLIRQENITELDKMEKELLKEGLICNAC